MVLRKPRDCMRSNSSILLDNVKGSIHCIYVWVIEDIVKMLLVVLLALKLAEKRDFTKFSKLFNLLRT